MSSWSQANRGKNLVWFGEIERKLAKLSMTTLFTVLPLNYFMLESQLYRDREEERENGYRESQMRVAWGL
jgi:hypothetical protein